MHNGERVDIKVKSGDKVTYSEFAGIEVTVQGANGMSAIIS